MGSFVGVAADSRLVPLSHELQQHVHGCWTCWSAVLLRVFERADRVRSYGNCYSTDRLRIVLFMTLDGRSVFCVFVTWLDSLCILCIWSCSPDRPMPGRDTHYIASGPAAPISAPQAKKFLAFFVSFTTTSTCFGGRFDRGSRSHVTKHPNLEDRY